MGPSISDVGDVEPARLFLREPRSGEAAALTALCMRSKGAWGYDAAFMRACRDELAITEAMIAAAPMRVAERGGDAVGVAQLELGDGDAELVKLFVEPGQLRTGAGRRLFDWAAEAARRANARMLLVDSDPYAAGFYRRMGMLQIGEAPSGSIPGRMLPRLKLEL